MEINNRMLVVNN